MNSFASALAPTSTRDDDGWDDLLSFIEERRVIPIVGPELLLVNTEHGPRLLYSWPQQPASPPIFSPATPI